MGAGGSIERGEMEVFKELLDGLGAVPGVIEVGLTGPKGQIDFSSKGGQIGKAHSDIQVSGDKVVIEKTTEENFFMARGLNFEKHCQECHDDASIGELAGIL